MSVVDINPAIRTKIYNFADANSYDVAWPNEEFEPSDTYLRFYVMQSDTAPFGMGVGSVEDYSGILQIDIVFKVNSGMSEAETIKIQYRNRVPKRFIRRIQRHESIV